MNEIMLPTHRTHLDSYISSVMHMGYEGGTKGSAGSRQKEKKYMYT